MSWRVVADRDVRDPFRSMNAIVLFGGFALVYAAVGYLASGNPRALASLCVSVGGPLVTLAALGVTYRSIAGAREDGSLRVTLGYPISRRDVVVGTALGRTAVVAGALTVGYVVALVVCIAAGGFGVDAAAFAGTWLVGCLLAAAVVALGVGVSASTRTGGRAGGSAALWFLLFYVGWGWIPTLVRYVAAGFRFPTGATPTWARVFAHLDPTSAYTTAATLAIRGRVPGPLYAGAAFAVAVLLAWTLLAPALGYVRFERTDL